MLYIPAREITKGNRTASDVQVKKWARVVSVVCKPGYRRTLTAATDAVISVFHSFPDFPGPASEVPIVEDYVFEKYPPWYLSDLSSKDDRGPSALERIQKLYRPMICRSGLMSALSK